jgi:hypothetical protein
MKSASGSFLSPKKALQSLLHRRHEVQLLLASQFCEDLKKEEDVLAIEIKTCADYLKKQARRMAIVRSSKCVQRRADVKLIIESLPQLTSVELTNVYNTAEELLSSNISSPVVCDRVAASDSISSPVVRDRVATSDSSLGTGDSSYSSHPPSPPISSVVPQSSISSAVVPDRVAVSGDYVTDSSRPLPSPPTDPLPLQMLSWASSLISGWR